MDAADVRSLQRTQVTSEAYAAEGSKPLAD